eukprot:11197177-Lingulodinium_polyedra.AAC.1
MGGAPRPWASPAPCAKLGPVVPPGGGPRLGRLSRVLSRSASAGSARDMEPQRPDGRELPHDVLHLAVAK